MIVGVISKRGDLDAESLNIGSGPDHLTIDGVQSDEDALGVSHSDHPSEALGAPSTAGAVGAGVEAPVTLSTLAASFLSSSAAA